MALTGTTRRMPLRTGDSTQARINARTIGTRIALRR